MTDRLESELRAALRARADRVPVASAARITARDYRPRTRGVRPPLAIGAAVTAAGAAGAVAAIVSLSTGASNAFAGWTPTPTAPSPVQLASARADCQAHSPLGGLPLRVTDTRGPFTLSVYANATSTATCISGPGFTAVSASASSTPLDAPAGHVLLSTSHLTNRDGRAYSFADGHTGAGVTAVTLILDDGTSVVATVAHDWFVAWWPSAHAVKAAQIVTANGVRTQTFDLAHQSPCGAHMCTGGARGTGSFGPVTAHGGESSGQTVSGDARGAGYSVRGAVTPRTGH